jgi:hypothetical protein
VSKIILVFKKGDKSNIENYGLISNLHSSNKIFEKFIIKRIDEIPPKKWGSKWKCLAIVSRNSEAPLHEIMSSLDLSAAFDVVNIKL